MVFFSPTLEKLKSLGSFVLATSEEKLRPTIFCERMAL